MEQITPTSGSVTSREFSLMPFWFWNDDLSETEICRQIADFEAHGVYGFVIHPRVGLPRHLGWMSDSLLRFMRIAIEEADRRDMKVILYDEGMYPSGSSSGQVVAEDPAYACRGLAKIELQAGESLHLPVDANLIAELTTATGRRTAVIDRRVDAYVRGLHYHGEGPSEDEPPMADILNPDAVNTVIRLVYDRFAQCFASHFGRTIIGIFTDEPNALGKCREADVWPGTAGILHHVNTALGYDFTPHLPALWFEDEPDAQRFRADYQWAIQRRLEQTWYQALSTWCQSHRIALCGHPAAGDEIGVQRYFDIPGQDLVWRFVEPGKPSALEGPESTQAKCSSSAMIHLGRRRNSNEFCGAYGPQTTFAEMKWLADWCLVRGVNMLIPHAFYYSVRGPRRDERPPQLGPNSPWWNQFKTFADHCARLSWINTDCTHVCDIAILASPDHCPWRAAKVCFESQHDFNYVEHRILLDDAEVDAEGIRVAGMYYRLLIVDAPHELPAPLARKLTPLIQAGRVFAYQPSADRSEMDIFGTQSIAEDAATLVKIMDRLCTSDVKILPSANQLRFRHVVKENRHFYIFHNEGAEPLHGSIQLDADGVPFWMSPATGKPADQKLRTQLDLAPFELAVLTLQ